MTGTDKQWFQFPDSTPGISLYIGDDMNHMFGTNNKEKTSCAKIEDRYVQVCFPKNIFKTITVSIETYDSF